MVDLPKQIDISYVTTPVVRFMASEALARWLPDWLRSTHVENQELKEQLAQAFEKKDVNALIDVIKDNDIKQIISILHSARAEMCFDSKIVMSTLIQGVKNIHKFLSIANNDIDQMNDLVLVLCHSAKDKLKRIVKSKQIGETVLNNIRWTKLEQQFLDSLNDQDKHEIMCHLDFPVETFDARLAERFIVAKGF